MEGKENEQGGGNPGAEEPKNDNLERLLAETVSETEKASQTEGKAQASDAAAGAQAVQAEENRKQALLLAEAGALESINMMAGLLKKRYPHLSVDDEERQRVAAAAAPVMLKHAGGQMPAWLLPYAEEFRLGMALSGVAFGLWLQAQAHEEAMQRAQQQAELERQNGVMRNAQAARAEGHPGAPGGGAAAPIAPAPVVDLSAGPMAGIPGGVTL